jgi:NCAIR mutase (PurE)-related protein
MDSTKLAELLQALENGQISSQQAFEQLKTSTYDELSFAKVDSYRKLRHGVPEVIFGPGKTAAQIIEIAIKLLAQNQVVIATKVELPIAQAVLEKLPSGQYDKTARMLIFGTPLKSVFSDVIAVVTAGTGDLPVAEEAALYLVASGARVSRIFDVGVAGIHRLFPYVETLNESSVVIVIAGMDGALASVIGGLVSVPVIAVPTSVGYGASFHGLSALLAMLSSCAAGLTTVNIDNGFGAAVAAMRIISSKNEAKLKNEAKPNNEPRLINETPNNALNSSNTDNSEVVASPHINEH